MQNEKKGDKEHDGAKHILRFFKAIQTRPLLELLLLLLVILATKPLTHPQTHMFCSLRCEIESFAYIAETINYLYVFWCKSRWPCFTIFSLFHLQPSLFVFHLSFGWFCFLQFFPSFFGIFFVALIKNSNRDEQKRRSWELKLAE